MRCYFKSAFKLVCILFLSFTVSESISAQYYSKQLKGRQFFDSLSLAIKNIENEIPELKQNRDPSLYHQRKKLDHARFELQFETFIKNEELYLAQDLVDKKLRKAELRKEKSDIRYYKSFETRIDKEIKYQKMYYQELFAEEKNFKKAFKKLTRKRAPQQLQRAKDLTEMAIKYAKESNLPKTAEMLNGYLIKINAWIFDHNSSYDLDKITKKEKHFHEIFQPLVNSDSLEHIKSADTLINRCYSYSKVMNTRLDTAFFAKQRKNVNTALSDYYDKDGLLTEVGNLSAQATELRKDTINPNGVYKWNDYIVVVNTFSPKSSYEKMQKGEAMIYADKILAKYIRINDLSEMPDKAKIGKTFFMPYVLNNQVKYLYYNAKKNVHQFMIVYTLIESPEYTASIRKFLPPMHFDKPEDSFSN